MLSIKFKQLIRFVVTMIVCVMTIPIQAQIIDSDITLEKALEGTSAPEEVIKRLVIVSVRYYSTDGLLHQGQIIVDSSLKKEVISLFDYIEKIKYPVEMVIPIRFDLPNNGTTMADWNNTYSFHYRPKAGGNNSLSLHSFGKAIDFNPFSNPYVNLSGTIIPAKAQYNVENPQTLTADHPLVIKFQEYGWIWGGLWTDPKDYMHFQKDSIQ